VSILGCHQYPTIQAVCNLELDVGRISEFYFFNLSAQNTGQNQVPALLYMTA
jgi:hypothetical protein